MTLAEILKSCGVADDTAQAVLDAMKQNKVYTASEENLDVRYGKLKTQHESTAAQLTEAQALIEQMKKETKGNGDLQQKITDYEAQVAALQAALTKTQVESAIKVGLLEGKALDADAVDYLTYQLTKGGEELTLGDDGRIKGWDDKLAGLKTRYPGQFESAGTGGRKYEEHKLPEGQTGGEALTREKLLRMPYAERNRIFNENPDAFRAAMK